MQQSKESKLLIYSMLIMFVPYIISLVTHETQNAWCVHLLNDNHTEFFDYFFKYTTNLGDGLALIPFLVILLIVRKEYWSVLVMASALHGIFVYVGKEIILKGTDFALRPAGLHGADAFNQILDVHMHLIDTFPSGHATTGFVIGAMFMLIIPNWKGFVIGMSYGLIVAISRMYLGQHFLVDVSFGGISAFAIVWLCWYICDKKGWIKLKPWEK
ncbi:MULTISPECIES: phosphatase PAP2 family protein [Flammeovirga]|uniref:Phosphatase PAP2 family protein n=1 Tax=Flammeovirga agarivorans TaxID=2726742 RepID=A0A7X8SJ96_9BACT|nr:MULTISPECIES: phosphatase PAP2 family protein [Flammeovirga]NLR91236.1 phosphatase PAP2 family protein [Flammeovirga agarivorans]